MAWWRDLWVKRARTWTFTQIAGREGPAIEPETVYLTGVLRSASIRNVRRGPKTFFGAVHSFASLPHYDQPAEFVAVTTPARLRDVDAEHLESIVVLDKVIFGPVPYRGGPLELEIGLFSLQSRDLTAPMLDLLDLMASLAGVSFVDVARPFVAPLVRGIEALTGLDGDAVLELGLAKTFPRPEAGDFLVMKAARDDVETKGWRLDADGTLRDAEGEDVRDCAYFTFSVEASDERSDWFEIPSIRAAHTLVREAVREGRLDRANEAVGAFKLAALSSGDLLPRDAVRLSAKLQDVVQEAMPATLTASATSDIGRLEELRLYR